MPDARGLLTPEEYSDLLKTRVGEQWERYDSIVIGPGARNVDDGWFNTWAEFAASEELTWLNGRSTNVGRSYSNQLQERSDWAQDIYQTLVEFIAPPGNAQLDNDPNDATYSPTMFVQQLANFMPFRVQLATSDEMVLTPGSHMPSGFGTAYASADASAAPTVFPGSQGEPVITQGWKWPEPLRLAAKSMITITARIDQPFRGLFNTLPGPGSKLVPDGVGGTIAVPNWYVIRVTCRGPRYLQLRGARSSA